jgi:hypothetical protein
MFDAPGSRRELPAPLTVIGWGIGATSLLALLYCLFIWMTAPGSFPSDIVTYYLAGQRLNTDGALYDMRPADPWHAPPDKRIHPLFSPPLMGAIWRPLAALPDGWGIVLWWGLMAFAAAAAIAICLRQSHGWAGIPILILAIPITHLIGVGNVDSLVLLGTMAVLPLLERGRDREVGLVVGILASLKLTPAILLVWLLASGRWRALRWAMGGILALAVLAVIATEPGIFPRYLRVMSEQSEAFPLARIAIVMLAATTVLAGRHVIGFVAAVLAMPLGAVQIHSWAVVLASVSSVARRPRPLATTPPAINLIDAVAATPQESGP